MHAHMAMLSQAQQCLSLQVQVQVRVQGRYHWMHRARRLTHVASWQQEAHSMQQLV